MASDLWQERWIDGSTPNRGAFALVRFNASLDELTVTEFDDRVFVIAHHEWLPVDAPQGDEEARYELTVTDWDGQELDRRSVSSPPAPPTSLSDLEFLLTDAGTDQ